jgi:hypothetical protein
VRRRQNAGLTLLNRPYLDFELARSLEDVGEVRREVEVVVDDKNAPGHANHAPSK